MSTRRDTIEPEHEQIAATSLESIQILPYPAGVAPTSTSEGDKEFAGHGPEVDMYVSIYVLFRNQLYATAWMSAKETEWDWSTVGASRGYHIWDGDAHGVTEIVSIDSDTFTEASYTDTDHDQDSIWMGFDELVREFRVTGDTSGDDVGSGTSMYALFNPVSMTVRKPDGQQSMTVDLDSYPYTPANDPLRHYPEHVGEGDHEFEGHGPYVYVSASLSIQNTNELWAVVYMYARETEWDWTTAAEIEGYKVWDGDDHGVREIVSIDSDTFTNDSYTDTDHAEDVLSQRTGELVDRFEATGDTSGDDVGSGTDVEVYFNPVELTVIY